MRAVGIRELKNRLSEYIRLTRAGERFFVTDRGEVVAELRRPGIIDARPEHGSGLASLAAAGRISLGAPNESDLYPRLCPLMADADASALLEAERDDR